MNQTEEQKQFEEGLIEFGVESHPIPKELTDLSWIGRSLRQLTNDIELLVQYERAEVEKIQAFTKRRLDKTKEQIERLNEMAHGLLATNGGYGREHGQAKFYAMPGIGRFSFGSTRESVDDSAYKEMSPEGQKMLQSKYSQWFTKTISIRPDKANILLALKAFTDAEAPGFRLKEKTETFKFKAE